MSDELFKVETHGIDPIPDAERHGGASPVFWLWSGANLTYTNLISGALAVVFGLSFWQAVTAIIGGHLLFLLVGLAGLGGARTGTATLVVARAAFGRQGGNAPGALNWLVSLGYIIANASIGVLALQQITGNRAVAFVLVIGATMAVAVWGHATVQSMERWVGWALAAGFLVVAALVVPEANVGSVAPAGFAGWTSAVVVVASIPVSYMALASDYSRYLPKRTPAGSIVWSTMLGSMIPAIGLGVIGAAAATQADMTDPVAGLSGLLPEGFRTVFLLLVLFGTTLNSIVCLYSSGLNMQVLGLPIGRAKAVLVAVVPVTGGTAVALYHAEFNTTLVDFLSLTVIVFAPWTGVFLTDMWRRRCTYDVEALYRGTAHAFNVPGLISLAVGICMAALLTINNIWAGPLAEAVGGDLALLGGVVSATLYFLFTRSQAKELPHAADADRAGSPAPVHGG